MRVMIYRDYKEEGWESMQVYADNLATSLRRMTKKLRVDEFVAFPTLSQHLARDNKLFRYVFRFAVNPLFAPRHQGDVNHIIDQANAHLLAVLDPKKTIVTCHDLIVPYWVMHNVHPQTYKKRIKRIVELWRIGYLKKAARIIAVSHATKKEIIDTIGINPEKIAVVPEGVDEIFTAPLLAAELRSVRLRYALPERYVLHVGTTHEYKNMEGLLKAVAHLRRNDRSLKLVKVGTPWTRSQSRLIDKLLLAPHISHLGFVPKEDLPGIYASALSLIHPSYTEGFGFTVLEAMAAGCPVIVSDIPALREMAGAAGIYINPAITVSDIRRIYSAIHSSQKRARLKSLGRKRATYFSWSRTAKLTDAIYREVAAQQRKNP
ncbi:glycosyltransferase family 4 protein [Candidatus Gottesmanbacteria bacterium]|nr:glycosyltransferase family 4 protein [Candidatus Gottesmanbacteria bacterium]